MDLAGDATQSREPQVLSLCRSFHQEGKHIPATLESGWSESWLHQNNAENMMKASAELWPGEALWASSHSFESLTSCRVYKSDLPGGWQRLHGAELAQPSYLSHFLGHTRDPEHASIMPWWPTVDSGGVGEPSQEQPAWPPMEEPPSWIIDFQKTINSYYFKFLSVEVVCYTVLLYK